jgi:hypothetical protein
MVAKVGTMSKAENNGWRYTMAKFAVFTVVSTVSQ